MKHTVCKHNIEIEQSFKAGHAKNKTVEAENKRRNSKVFNCRKSRSFKNKAQSNSNKK